MNIHLQKARANTVPTGKQESPSAANRVSQKQAASKPTLQWVDHRPEALQSRELQQLANSGPQSRRAIQLQALADDNASEQPLPFRNQLSNTLVTQRKVYIGEGNQVKNIRSIDKLTFCNNPGGDGNDAPEEVLTIEITSIDCKEKVKSWIGDDIHRHFLSDVEMQKYLAEPRRTDYIGILPVDDNRVWLRFDPKSLYVIGEQHDKTQMRDLVSAVHTSRYMDEAYGKIPNNRENDFLISTAGAKQFIKDVESQMKLPENNNEVDHHLEDLFRQVQAGLTAVLSKCTLEKAFTEEQADKIDDANNKGETLSDVLMQHYFTGATLAEVFGLGLGIANDVYVYCQNHINQVGSSMRALAEAWKNKSVKWLEMIEKIDNGECIQILIKDNFDDVYDMTRLLMTYIHDDYEAQFKPSHSILKYGPFKHYRLRHIRRSTKGMNETIPNVGRMCKNADKWREEYMMERIKYANSNKGKYMLIGMGEDHLERLVRKFLPSLGIEYMFMTDLIEKAKAANKAIEEKAT